MKFGLGLFLISILASFILLNPSIKSKTLALFVGTQREVLSQLIMEEAGQSYKILKVKTVEGLLIEIYKVADDQFILLDSQTLTDKKDAHYKFGSKKHNLFLKDINNDGQSEIILPSLDKNMKARLNVFHFDPISEKLQKVTPH